MIIYSLLKRTLLLTLTDKRFLRAAVGGHPEVELSNGDAVDVESWVTVGPVAILQVNRMSIYNTHRERNIHIDILACFVGLTDHIRYLFVKSYLTADSEN